MLHELEKLVQNHIDICNNRNDQIQPYNIYSTCLDKVDKIFFFLNNVILQF